MVLNLHLCDYYMCKLIVTNDQNKETSLNNDRFVCKLVWGASMR